MQFGIPYSLLEIPDSSGVISFSINETRKLLVCLTEKSIQLYDNSSYFPILVTSLTQFFESFDIKGPDAWIEWMTDEDIAFGTNNGIVHISHVLISERDQPIHDYDNDFYKKFLNRYEFIKVLAPIQVSIFNQSANETEPHPYVTSVFSAHDHICVCTSESKVYYINKNAQITNSIQLFSKPNCITHACYFPPATLFLKYENSPYFISFDLQSFQSKKELVIEELPIKNPTLFSINYQQTYLAVYKQEKGKLRIFQLGLPEWKPPITVYASIKTINQENMAKNNSKICKIDSINDPVIHLFWNTKGNSLIIIHRSGKSSYFFLESKTIHTSSIDYFCQQYQQQQQKEESNKEDINSTEKVSTEKVSTEIQYKFLFDRYGERLFVSNGKSIVLINLLQNRNFYLFTPSWIFDLRKNLNLYNGTSLYPIQDISLDFNNEIIIVSNDKGFQLFDEKEAKIISDFIPVVSEANKKRRRLLDAHFIGNNICVIVGPQNNLSNDKFELNFCDKNEKEELDCDNEFYRQFDNVYLYDDINKKELKEKEKESSVLIDEGNEIKSIVLLFSINRKENPKNDKEFIYELKPDLLIKSFFIPKFFDFIEDHGIFADEQNIAYINIMNKLTNPSRHSIYYLTKSKKIFSVYVHTIKEKVRIREIAMSTANSARFLTNENLIRDEQLKVYGEEMFVTNEKKQILFDDLFSTKAPPVVFYCYSTRTIEGKSYSAAFYKAFPIFSCFDNFLRVLEIPFAFDGMIFYVLPENLTFGKFYFKFINIGHHILIESIKDYRLITYLINFIYRKFNQIPKIAVETFKEVLKQDFLPQIIMILFPHLELNEISQIIQFLPTQTSKQVFSPIFDAIYNYISYSNKYYNDTNKQYMEITINNRKFSSKIINLGWNKIFSLIDSNIRNHIFLNISPNTFAGLVNEMNLETKENKDLQSENNKIFNDELIQFLFEKGEIVRAYSVSNKENSNHFCELFKKIICNNKQNNFKDNFFEALNLMEKEKIQWNSNSQMYPIVFHFLGCLFQTEDLSLFSAASFIIIGQKQKFQAVIISDESIKNKIEKYLNENPDGIYVKEIKEVIDSINK